MFPVFPVLPVVPVSVFFPFFAISDAALNCASVNTPCSIRRAASVFVLPLQFVFSAFQKITTALPRSKFGSSSVLSTSFSSFASSRLFRQLKSGVSALSS